MLYKTIVYALHISGDIACTWNLKAAETNGGFPATCCLLRLPGRTPFT